MSHELSIPADALARINMLFRTQKKAEMKRKRGSNVTDKQKVAMNTDSEDKSSKSPGSPNG